jgi:hypothetical protein
MQRTFTLLTIIVLGILASGFYRLAAASTPQNPDQWQDPIPVNLNSQFPLRVDQVAIVESDKLKIKFLKVEEDSRCPSGVTCVWSGQVKILVNVVKDERDVGNIYLIIRDREEDLAVKTFDGYSIKLVEVTPYPKGTSKIEISNYIVNLVISRL